MVVTLDLSPGRPGKAERSSKGVSNRGKVESGYKSGEFGKWGGAGPEKILWL